MRIILFLRRYVPVFIFAAIITFVVVISQYKDFHHFNQIGDAASYIAMASNHPERIAHPYHARRVLHPWLVSQLASCMSIDQAFLVTGIITLYLFIFFVLITVHSLWGRPFLFSSILIFLPFLFSVYRSLYTQTLMVLCIESIYFFLLVKKRYILSLFALLLLLFTREDTIVVAVGFIIALLVASREHIKKSRIFFYISGVIAALGIWWLRGSHLSKDSVNIHHMSPLLVYVVRIPLVYMHNLTGFTHWVDTYRNHILYPDSPLFFIDTPRWMYGISRIRQFGIYDWRPGEVFQTFLLLLSTFGTAPTIILYACKQRLIRLSKNSFALNAIFFSGMIGYLLGPGTGMAYVGLRYYLNAWPLFLLFISFLYKLVRIKNKNAYFILVACYVLAGWLPTVLKVPTTIAYVPVLALEICLHVITWFYIAFAFQVIPCDTNCFDDRR